MRKPILLLSCFFVLSAAQSLSALTPKIQLDVPMVVSGTPLKMDVNLSYVRPSETIGAQVLLDGQNVGRVVLKAGQHAVVLDDVRPKAGAHTVTLKSASLEVSQDFHLVSGWLSIAPPLIAILLALLFKDVLLSLFLGILSGAWILQGWDPFAAFGRTADTYIVGALVDADRLAIIVFTCFLGGMVGLITKSGGTHGVIELLTPYATSQRRGQLATAAMGMLIFFDDYANTLIVGPTMRPITDRLKISREKLAYIVDSTAAPVVCLFPISTWVGFELGLIGEAFKSIGLEVDPYTTFIGSIPYRFYPIFALTLVITLALSRYDFGPMRAAEHRARTTGQVLAPDARPIADYSTDEVEPPADAPKRAINALLPIVTVILMTLVGIYRTGANSLASSGVDTSGMGTDQYLRTLLENANSYHALLWASLSGMIVALLLTVSQRILPVEAAIRSMFAGIKAMLMALMVLTLAWSLSDVCSGLDTAQFLVGLTQHSLSPVFLPVLTFVLSAAVAFATGSSWGTMGILEPLVIPIAHQLCLRAGMEVWSEPYQALMLATIASVLTGSVWGDHCSPISDTTILSSMASGCDHIAHVRTQLPYALSLGLLSIVTASLSVGLGVSPWVFVGLGIMVIVGVVLGLGKRQKGDGGDEPQEGAGAAEQVDVAA